MGQTLSEPVTTKDTKLLCSKDYLVGVSSMQGWRINMEDALTAILSLEKDKTASFFAVYDGHGGAQVANYCEKYVHSKVTSDPAFMNGKIEEAIKNSFLSIDEDMLSENGIKDDTAGSTAIVVIIKDNKIFCGNVGDSRAVASVQGNVQELSYDHKPSNDEETRRIVAAGGWVEFNRVNGNLALSRALGDFCFKKNDQKSAVEQIVTAWPDVIVKDLTPEHEFLVLACDGIWDVLSNEEVVEFVRCRIAQGMKPDKICEELLTRCLAPDCDMGGLGCDNMTVILVCLLANKSYEELVVKCQRPSS
ncbi:probable protein phosphatase 2C T23F11.1 [Xenia sp. Carnegie-2017]|uniref:probable protein phosphatase 2C T23F11.1 n=1 Tax=Xenia sp. Carnegie-2017 TaxID=2897299 RepID=UPI001F043522|nr:probable protein phosphatase 2C T23F11.1 [Xenia sp. Carnegie-2017]